MTVHIAKSDAQQDSVKAWLHSNVPLFVRELLAGGAAGAVAKTCVAPLERTKILLMTGRSQTGAYGTLRLILASEGVRGLFRGNLASCLRIMPYAAIHFSVYEVYRRLLTEQYLPSLSAPPSSSCKLASTPSGAGRNVDAGSGGSGLNGHMNTTAEMREISAGASSPLKKSVVQTAAELVPSVALTSSIDVASSAAVTVAEHMEAAETLSLPPSPPSSSSSWAAAGQTLPATAAAECTTSTAAAGADTTAVRQQMQPQGQQHHSPFVDLLAGSAAGSTAVLLTYPLDVIRTRLAWAVIAGTRPLAAPATGAGPSSLSGVPKPAASSQADQSRIVPMLALILRHEGILGLYRGLAPTLYGIMPYAGLKFFVYGSLKQWYRREAAASSLSQGSYGSGGTGNGSSSSSNGSNVGTSDRLGSESCSAGGDHRGGASRQPRQRHGGERLPVPYMLAFGGISGLFAQTITYPLDVIRRRMQVYGMQHAQSAAVAVATGVHVSSGSRSGGGGGSAAASALPSRPTTWSTAVAIIRHDGLRGLVRGMSINYVKVVPSTAIGFTTYELFKSYLGVSSNL